MKKLIFIAVTFILFSTHSLLSQETSVIKVHGTSSIAVAPTQIVINMNLESIKDSYSEAIQDLITRVNSLTEKLDEIQIKKNERFTSLFNIRDYTIYDSYTRRDTIAGYRAFQSLIITIDLDMKRLINILNEVTKDISTPNISIRFSIKSKDKKKYIDNLIESAVKDAKKKAEIIAKTSGYKIIGIKEVNYGFNKTDKLFMNDVVGSFSDIRENSMSAPQDIIISDEVNIIYLISK